MQHPQRKASQPKLGGPRRGTFPVPPKQATRPVPPAPRRPPRRTPGR
jgi:hypothetical protein